VYFGHGRLAYRLDYNQMSAEGRERWREDLQAHNLEDIRGSGKYR